MTARILWGSTFENAFDFDRLDIQASGRPLMAGAEQERPGAIGVEDAWSAYEYTLTGDMRWVDPSVWSGPGGVRDWLSAAQEKGAFRYVPDIAFPDFWVQSFLADPPGGAGRLEPNEQRRLPVLFRNPTVDYSLARRGLFFEFGPQNGLVPPQFAHTRAGRAGFLDVNLTRQLAEAGVLRDRDYWSGTRVATLEGAHSTVNMCPEPEELELSPWASTDTTIVVNATVAPTRGFTAEKIVEGTGSAQHTRHFEFSATASQVLAATVYLKPAERTKVQVYFSDSFAGADKMGCQVDLNTLAISNIVSGAGVIHGVPKARLVTNSAHAGAWVELRFSGVATTSTTPDFVIRLCDAAGSGTYTGDGTSGLYAWGVMVTKGSSTTSSYFDGTRVADAVLMSWPWKPQPMWVYLKFIEVGSAAANTGQGPFRIGLTDNAPYKFLRFDTFTGTDKRYRFSHQDGIVGVSSGMSTTTPVIGDTVELLGLLFSDGSVQIKHSLNGAAEVAGSQSSAFALDPIWTAQNAGFPLDYSCPFVIAKAGRGTAINTVALARTA